MKAQIRMFSALTSVSAMMLLSACGPAPNPKLQAGSAEPREQTPAPAANEQLAPVPFEEPRQEIRVKPKQEAPVKRDPAKPASTPQLANSRTPDPSPTQETASAASRTLTLPVPVASPIAEPVAPADEPKPAEPPAPRRIRVPSGTLVAVRMIDSIDSETANGGETFKASLDAPIVVDNETVFPIGAEVYVKLSKVQSAGRVRGRSELQLQLDRIFLGAKSYLLESSTYVITGASQAGRTAKTAGLGAAIGAAIGGISGGAKGAVIGGATGAGAGAGVEAIRKGEQVRVDSETQLEFRLEESVEVSLDSASASPQRTNPSGPLRFGTRQ